ncbi:hypothetical protein [Paenibacillus sp. S28]|uniref:hypothetical protein n=1 Tax=Paenibacillus sp. S28 TaxID=2767463 RepID=UPI00190C33B9|nr:hypothetical protein [Paenibacillus sp. S28]MBJ9989405.1 hypothetical protein [Paenibacillus sp. S28]
MTYDPEAKNKRLPIGDWPKYTGNQDPCLRKKIKKCLASLKKKWRAALADFENEGLNDLFQFVRKKSGTETTENESADFVGCFLAGGYSY